MTKTINSPFRYAGGKFYARKLILEYLTPHTHYLEPFAGGASIFFAKNKVRSNWLNDLDPNLINCLTMIRDFPQELSTALNGEIATKERHAFYKNEFEPQNELEKALRWYYLNRTSYSGIMNMKNCYFGYGDKFSMRPENWGANILRTSHKLQGVKLTCLDFESVLKQIPTNESYFLFIDPPYFNAAQDKFYTHSFSAQDHIRLAALLEEHKNRFNFLLTYDNALEIRELYNWAEIHDKEWNYAINRTDDQKNKLERKGTRYKGQEIFIFNYTHTPQLNLLDFSLIEPQIGFLEDAMEHIV